LQIKRCSDRWQYVEQKDLYRNRHGVQMIEIFVSNYHHKDGAYT